MSMINPLTDFVLVVFHLVSFFNRSTKHDHTTFFISIHQVSCGAIDHWFYHKLSFVDLQIRKPHAVDDKDQLSEILKVQLVIIIRMGNE